LKPDGGDAQRLRAEPEKRAHARQGRGDAKALTVCMATRQLLIMTTKKAVVPTDLIPVERIASNIYLVRGQKVMIDSDLASLYEVETRVLVQAVKRNIARFPGDFMFQLSKEELDKWRSQIVTSNPGTRMGLRYAPYAFTEQGVAMLSSVLRSNRAIEINIAIIRTFVKLREVLAGNEELARMVAKHDRQISVLFENVQKMLAPVPVKKHPIGFVPPREE
jgi:hypothetical protein